MTLPATSVHAARKQHAPRLNVSLPAPAAGSSRRMEMHSLASAFYKEHPSTSKRGWEFSIWLPLASASGFLGRIGLSVDGELVGVQGFGHHHALLFVA